MHNTTLSITGILLKRMLGLHIFYRTWCHRGTYRTDITVKFSQRKASFLVLNRAIFGTEREVIFPLTVSIMKTIIIWRLKVCTRHDVQYSLHDVVGYVASTNKTVSRYHTRKTVLDRESRSDRPRYCVTMPTRAETLIYDIGFQSQATHTQKLTFKGQSVQKIE